MSQLTAISFFSGAGGIDVGLEAAGFRVLAASDIMSEACATLSTNFQELQVIGPPAESGDINDIRGEGLLERLGIKQGQVDLIVGGPPCQPFSVAAAQRFLKGDAKFKRIGFESPDKGELVFRFAERILELRPRAFLIENVPGILSIDGGNGIRVVYQMLEEAGYTVSAPFVLNARDFGVPQSRKRAFVIGSLEGHAVSPPAPTHSEFGDLLTEPWITVAQALVGMPKSVPNHIPRNHSPESIARYRRIGVGKREQLGRVDRLDPRSPSKTVIAGGTSGGGRSHLHPYLARTLSVRECARIQTFPDTYVFQGSSARQFTLVGNAVPPLLAEHLARHIATEFFGVRYNKPLILQREVPDLETSIRKLLKTSRLSAPDLLYEELGV